MNSHLRWDCWATSATTTFPLPCQQRPARLRLVPMSTICSMWDSPGFEHWGTVSPYELMFRAKKNLIINDALFFLLTSSFMSYSFENLELTSECSEASCVKCGAVTNNMLEEDSPCVSVAQQKVCLEVPWHLNSLLTIQVRVAASKFRKGGTLCALCACRLITRAISKN